MKKLKTKLKRTIAAVLVALLLLMSSAVPAMAEAFSAIVTSKSMQVYGDVAMTELLGTLGKNSVVRVTGYSTTIAKITYQGRIGYAKVSDMKRVEDVSTKAMTTEAAEVHQSPDIESDSVTVPAGTMVNVLGTSGEWAAVEKGGAVGYVKANLLQDAVETPGETASDGSAGATTTQPTQENGITIRTFFAVTVRNTKIYRSASEKAKTRGTLKPGIQVTVLATSSNGWAYIQLNGKKGYCKLSDLKEGVAEDYTPAPSVSPAPDAQSGTLGVVNVELLPVYNKASTTGTLLGTLKQGQQVNVLKWNDEWAYIELNGNYGFCPVAGLTKSSSQTAPSPTSVPGLENARRATVTAKKLAVYQTAGTNGTKLGTLKKGQAVNVLQSSDGWAYIELNGQYGFCRSNGLKIDQQEGVPAGFKTANFTATVVTADARAYAATNTDSENVTMRQGSEVLVVGYNNTWACIRMDDKYAFMAVKALSKAEYEPISGDGNDLQTLLKALLVGGYFDSVPGTSYNAAAIAAIKRFQSACGMTQTGIADQNMLRIVYSGYAPVSELLYKTLKKGDKEDAVSRVQARLYALGYLTKTTSLTGEYGDITVSAVKLFQNTNSITATGTADPATLKALYSLDAKKLPAGSKAPDAGSSGGGSSSTYLDSVPAGLASTTTSLSSGMSNAEKMEYSIYLAQSKLGCPYVYGATGPDKFDCSGLTSWIYKAIGVKLQRTAYNQGYDDAYEKIEGWQNLKRGDLVYFNTISDSDLSDHAGVYIGDGYFIHASSGAHKVVVSNLTTGFYGRVFSWGRRILQTP